MSGRFALAFAAMMCATGCAFDLGGAVGIETQTAHAVGYGRAAVSTRIGSPLNERGFLLGAALESRSETDKGARWLAGAMFGWGLGPSSIGGGPVGFDIYGEVGTPLRSTLVANGDHYLGIGVDTPIRLQARRNIEDLNESTWLLLRRFEIVPFTRFRVHHDFGGPAFDARPDVSGGAAIRMRTLNDLF
ncbi:MAG: hypothetical protein BGO98_18520 [Myxococcales bacterium 68-20]|mgnify:CR=1 FL=1|nr:hypothetical protein [Myxococcales bacterium]OJY23924.1 MAG: hypothetical protein BGO98_18520 [Myxococcales bacterium 68-20]